MLEGSPFSLLTHLYGDTQMARIFSQSCTIGRWLEVEIALARAQAEVGVLSQSEAEQIAGAAVLENIDQAQLWEQAKVVGYPILPLVRIVVKALPPEVGGRVHYGATTQDIMDTALALQLREAMNHFEGLLSSLGDALADQVQTHRQTVMAARTHAQQAVPTTFGAKMATFLAEVGRHRTRLREIRPRVALISLFGAGGTGAALGPKVAEIRAKMAQLLQLENTDVPWHVSRDGLFEFAAWCSGMSGTCARLAQEIIDLSRTEIAEVREQSGHHRGASSTMPQKANPIDCEAIIGLSGVAGALVAAAQHAMQHGHERAAGQWQIEWQVLPQIAHLASSALKTSVGLVQNLQVFPQTMLENLDRDGGLIMAEAYMIRLAEKLGQSSAHDLVYQSSHQARREGKSLQEVLNQYEPIQPQDYLGEATAVCQKALELWRETA